MSNTASLAFSRPSEVRQSLDGNLIYAADANGQVLVYSVRTGGVVAAWKVGQNLGSMDISPDGSFLMVVERNLSTVYKVDTATGAVTRYPYATSGMEGLLFDVAVLSDGTALFSQNFPGSGWTSLKVLDLATGTYTAGQMVSQSSVLTRSPTGETVLIGEPNTSGGTIDIYQTGVGIVKTTGANGFNWGIQAYSGSLVAQYIYNEGIHVYDDKLGRQITLTALNNGRVTDLAFSSDNKWLYVLENQNNSIIKISTADWSVDSVIPVAADVGDWNGQLGSTSGARLILDPQGRYFSVVTDKGLVLVQNPDAPPVTGTEGADTLMGTLFADKMLGFGGDDVLVGGPRADQMDGGEGVDEATYFLSRNLVQLDLQSGTHVGDAAGDTFVSIERFRLSPWNDRFSGSDGNDRVDGNLGNDFLSGRDGDDHLTGGAGFDLLDGGRGSDTLIGGDGQDEVTYASAESAVVIDLATGSFGGAAAGDAVQSVERFTLTAFDDRFTGTRGVEWVNGGAGQDQASFAYTYRTNTVRFISIERVQFADGTLTFDPDSTAAKVARMYDTVLRRAPDAPGLDYWLDEIGDKGATLLSVAQSFLGSAEFQRATGSLSNAQYVDYLYSQALGRGSDADGKAYWVGQLDSGAQSRADLLVGFSESAEHRQLTSSMVAQGFFETDDAYQAVALLYDSFNQRLPDEGGLIHYGELVKSGALALAQIADQFAGSAEFKAATAGMSNAQIVDFMYQNTLDRLPDAAGRAYYIDQLNKGAMDLGDVLLDFSQSREHYNLLAPHITNGIALAGGGGTSTSADGESARMLMQQPDMRVAFEEPDTPANDLALANLAGNHTALEHLAAASRLDVMGF